MQINIDTFFNTPFGMVVFFLTPTNFVLKENMRLKNKRGEVWVMNTIIKGKKIPPINPNNDAVFVRGAYVTEAVIKHSIKKNLEAYFAKHTWEVCW